jgi:phage terminase large subunit GpA-like protein
MDLWDQYAKLLYQGATPAEGKQIATEYYKTHQEEMNAGGKVAWETDKQEDELSGLQSMMTIRAIDPEFFAKEIQQEAAPPQNTTGVSLDSGLIIKRLSQCERGYVPEQASYLTAFVDSQDQVLFWMVVAWGKDFSGWIVDYGTWPDQERPVFYKSSLARRLSESTPGKSWEEAFVHAHHCVDAHILKDWPTQNGTSTRQIDIMLKDWSDGQHKPHIESQILLSPDRHRIRPSKGFAPAPGKKPLHLWGDQHRDKQNGMEWVEKRSEHPVHVQYNTNIWKSNAARRLLTVVGAPSAVMLPGSDENEHKLLGEHFTAESPVNVTRDGVSGVKWELKPGRDNDFFDCYVGNCVAASMLGCGIGGERPQKTIRTFQIPGGSRRG